MPYARLLSASRVKMTSASFLAKGKELDRASPEETAHLLQPVISTSTQPTRQVFVTLPIREGGSCGCLVLLCCRSGPAGTCALIRTPQSLVLLCPAWIGADALGEEKELPPGNSQRAAQSLPPEGCLTPLLPRSRMWGAESRREEQVIYPNSHCTVSVFSDLSGACSSAPHWRLKACAPGESAGYMLPVPFLL